jgi:hypothetical protein
VKLTMKQTLICEICGSEIPPLEVTFRTFWITGRFEAGCLFCDHPNGPTRPE